MATLFIFAGLPATGKSTLSQQLARRLKAAYVRIDTIEQGLRDQGALRVGNEGYELAYRIAADNLLLGVDVVSDSCNPIELTRRAWQQVALDAGARFINIEVICSDPGEHRQRVERRTSSVPGLRLPTWTDILDREYHTWSDDRVVIDTAGQSAAECLVAMWSALGLAE
jgi:predicted kinase